MEIMKIAVGGSSANPPHLGHKAIIENLLLDGRFDRVYWIISGVRNDKVNNLNPKHRIAMTKIMLKQIDQKAMNGKFKLITTNANQKNTPTIIWLQRFQKKHPLAKITFFLGADLIIPQEKFGSKSEIEARWYQGEKLYQLADFLVFPRVGYDCQNNTALPENIKVFKGHITDISSSKARQKILNNETIAELTGQEIESYIKRYRLYQRKED